MDANGRKWGCVFLHGRFGFFVAGLGEAGHGNNSPGPSGAGYNESGNAVARRGEPGATSRPARGRAGSIPIVFGAPDDLVGGKQPPSVSIRG